MMLTPKQFLETLISFKLILPKFIFFSGTPGRIMLEAARELEKEQTLLTIQVLNERMIPLIGKALYDESRSINNEKYIPIYGYLAGDVSVGTGIGFSLRNGQTTGPAIALYFTIAFPVLEEKNSLTTSFNQSYIPINGSFIRKFEHQNGKVQKKFVSKLMELQGVCHLCLLDNPSRYKKPLQT